MGAEIIARATAGAASNVGVPSVIRCGVLIAVVKLLLGTVGFERTWRWIRRWSERVEVSGDGDPAVVAATEYAVAMAAAFFPGRAECLERSLVLYWYLRRRRVPVRYKMGVQLYPFLAHAWVEYRGHPINDVPEHVAQFTPIEGVSA